MITNESIYFITSKTTTTEIGSVGMDIWLAAIAYGAARVLLLVPPAVAASVVAELKVQLAVSGVILEGMGYPREILRLVRDPDDEQMITELDATETQFELRSAGFAGLDEKRTVIRLALDHLFQEAPAPRPLVSLLVVAPFGDVLLDEKRCTLCMACVSQRPGQALLAGDERPELGFVEEKCVQCALCASSCPENAIAPTPRYLYDREARRRRRVLKSEEPLCCIRCGKPFASRGTVERVIARLAGHPLFQGNGFVDRCLIGVGAHHGSRLAIDAPAGVVGKPPLGVFHTGAQLLGFLPNLCLVAE